MWSITDPGLHRPIQVVSNELGHFLLDGSVAPLLRRHGLALGLDAGPLGNLLDEIRRPLGEQVFVLDDPDISDTLVFFDGQKVADLIGP